MTDPLSVALALWLLASMDAGFAGFRDAAGRSPRLHKASMVRRRVGAGLLWAQGICLLMLVVLAVGVALAPDPGPLLAELTAVGARMVLVFGTYAAVVLSALAIYAVPHPDVSSLATVLVLGPFTLGRPAIVVGGLVWATRDASLPVAVAAAVSGGLVLLAGPLLQRHWIGRAPLDAHRG